MIDYLESLKMVVCVEKIDPYVCKVEIDKMENGMWFRDMLRNKNLGVIDRSHSKPIYYVEIK